jgi:hypothetical protein
LHGEILLLERIVAQGRRLYGIIAAGVSLAVIAAVKGIGTKLNTAFSSISTQFR